MKTLPTLTIGIPAYNEEHNIARLIERLLEQKRDGWILDKIIIYSDGSSDNTTEIIRQIEGGEIQLIDSKNRAGQAHAQQQIIKHTHSSYLVLLNADVLPKSNNFLSALIKPLGLPGVALTSARVEAIPGDTTFSKIIVWSHQVKSHLYEMLSPSTVYLCHGRARAFTRSFYKNLKFPPVIAEDAYSYFACRVLNYKFVFCPKATVIFRAPSTLSDHLLQSRRFFRGTKELHAYFPESILAQSYSIPPHLIVSTWLEALVKRPFYTLMYLLILTYSFFTNTFGRISTSAIWTPSVSSKQL